MSDDARGAVWRRGRRVLWRWSGARVVALTPGAAGPVVLDEVAALIWDLLAEPMDEADLMEHLAASYGIDRGSVPAAVRPFLEEMLDSAALERRSVDAS